MRQLGKAPAQSQQARSGYADVEGGQIYYGAGGADRGAPMRDFTSKAPRARLAILTATSHLGIMAEAERIAELATAFLDDSSPPRPTGFFEGMDVRPGSAPGPGNR